MWIKPKNQLKKNVQETKKSLNMTFAELYKQDVFTSKKDLEVLANYNKIDVIIFVGYAGCGHYAPARALALEYANKNKNVILVDPLYIYSETMAKFNCLAWKVISRHCNFLWKITRKILASSLGYDISLNFAKKLQTKEIYTLLKEKKPDVILSTYSYTNAILSDYTKYAKFTGIVVPDVSPVGFLGELNHKTKDLHFFLSSYEMYKYAMKIYPYIYINAGVHIMGTTPHVFNNLQKNNKGNILLFNPGSGIGIGKGFKALRTILNTWNGIILLLCGDNKKWLKKAKKYAKVNRKLIPFGFIEYDVLQNFYEVADVIVAKSGGSTVVELASLDGCKLIYAPIPCQEVENALEYEKLGCITYARNLDDLVKYLKEKPQTKSVYKLLDKEKSKNSAKFVVAETLKNI